METGSRYRSPAPLTYWVTRKGTFHWSLDCWTLRRAKIATLLVTEIAPTDPFLLCLNCFRKSGAPPGFVAAQSLSDAELDRAMRALPGGTNHGKVPTAESHDNDRSRMTETLDEYRLALVFKARRGSNADADELAIQIIEFVRDEFDVELEAHGTEAHSHDKQIEDNLGELAFDVSAEASGLFFGPDADYVKRKIEGKMIECGFLAYTVEPTRRP